MQISPLAIKFYFCTIAATIIGVADMQRLVQIGYEMTEK